MRKNEISEANSGKEGPTKTSWVDVVFIVLLINLGLVILVTVVATLLNAQFLSELLLLGVIAVLVFIVVILLILGISLGFPMIARRIFNWEEEREVNMIVNLLFITGGLFVIGAAIGIYFLVLPSFPLVQDPFFLGDIHPIVGIFYSLWWFIGFILSALIITLLYIGLETGRYS